MNNLNETLASITEKIKKFRSLYEQNEMAVRDQIVNPILRDLGWNPENPEEVQPNVSTEEGIPDYSLIKNGKKILFVEAKKLSVDIEQREVIRQLAKYSFSEGTKYGVLTNGAVWILIRSFEEGTTLTERIVWKVDLENEELPTVLRKIVTISKTNIEHIEVLVKKVQILDEIWQSLLDEPEEMIKGLIPVVKSIISQGYPSYQFEDSEIEDLLKERVKEIISGPFEKEAPPETTPIESISWRGSPRKMKLKGEIFELHNSFEILVNTANWLIKNGKLKASDCPVGIGRGKRNLINNEPKHKYGDAFRAPKKLSNGLWIETHYSTASCINYAKRLLEKFGVSSDILKIE
ncbi:MAG: type I restriction enzyme HsdR N-terminal domain-containing protein [Candidatus Hydrothermae bacterium]|nr:type I restriction enzyme HsdR N-terminal domain-containing protein [Candidatus Hydrothermae bacterium]